MFTKKYICVILNPYICKGVSEVLMKNIELNNIKYTLEKNYKDAFVYEEVESLCTEYFVDFDYIFGDYSYSRLRLKGFYDSKSKKAKEINNINCLDDYISNYCSYDCKYFLLRKENTK